MKKVDINNSTDENIAAAHGLTVEYVKRVKDIREASWDGDQLLAAVACECTPNYVYKVLCFARRNEKVLATMEKIAKNRAELLRDTPKIKNKLTESAI